MISNFSEAIIDTSGFDKVANVSTSAFRSEQSNRAVPLISKNSSKPKV